MEDLKKPKQRIALDKRRIDVAPETADAQDKLSLLAHKATEKANNHSEQITELEGKIQELETTHREAVEIAEKEHAEAVEAWQRDLDKKDHAAEQAYQEALQLAEQQRTEAAERAKEARRTTIEAISEEDADFNSVAIRLLRDQKTLLQEKIAAHFGRGETSYAAVITFIMDQVIFEELSQATKIPVPKGTRKQRQKEGTNTPFDDLINKGLSRLMRRILEICGEPEYYNSPNWEVKTNKGKHTIRANNSHEMFDLAARFNLSFDSDDVSIADFLEYFEITIEDACEKTTGLSEAFTGVGKELYEYFVHKDQKLDEKKRVDTNSRKALEALLDEIINSLLNLPEAESIPEPKKPDIEYKPKPIKTLPKKPDALDHLRQKLNQLKGISTNPLTLPSLKTAPTVAAELERYMCHIVTRKGVRKVLQRVGDGSFILQEEEMNPDDPNLLREIDDLLELDRMGFFSDDRRHSGNPVIAFHERYNEPGWYPGDPIFVIPFFYGRVARRQNIMRESIAKNRFGEKGTPDEIAALYYEYQACKHIHEVGQKAYRKKDPEQKRKGLILIYLAHLLNEKLKEIIDDMESALKDGGHRVVRNANVMPQLLTYAFGQDLAEISTSYAERILYEIHAATPQRVALEQEVEAAMGPSDEALEQRFATLAEAERESAATNTETADVAVSPTNSDAS